MILATESLYHFSLREICLITEHGEGTYGASRGVNVRGVEMKCRFRSICGMGVPSMPLVEDSGSPCGVR